MSHFTFSLFPICALLLLSSCSEQRLVANGARHDHPIHLGGEYTWEDLDPVEIQGKAVFGIPSANAQGGNFSKTGLIINLDGPGGFRFPKVVPLLTMLAGTFITASTLREMGGTEYSLQSQKLTYKMPYILTFPLAVPIWGAVQNVMYSGISNSGVSSELQRKWIEDNPDVDLFFNPSYDIKYQQSLFSQESTIKANVKGATMKPSN